MSTDCPGCGFPHCYNSGFSIECWNVTCRFYTRAQHDAVQEVRSKERSEKQTPVNANLWSTEDEERLINAFDRAEAKGLLPPTKVVSHFSGNVNIRPDPAKSGKKVHPSLYDDDGEENGFPDFSQLVGSSDEDDNA